MASEALPIYSPMKVQRTCAACAGTGIIYTATCQVCGHQLPDDDHWLDEGNLMACGHAVAHYVGDQYGCHSCQGTGWIERYLTQAEYRVRRRRKYLLAILVFILALLPFIALTWAVFAQDANLTFGTWLM